MADEPEQVAASGAPDDEAAEGKPKKKLPLTPVMIAFYVGVVFAASAVTERVIVPKVSQMLADKGLVHEEPVEEPVDVFGEIYVIEDLVVNPAGSGGTRYVAASIGLESSEPGVIGEIERRNPQIKDALIHILGSRTIEDLSDVQKREVVRQEIKQRVETILPEQGIDAVYFVSFVLQ